MAIISSLQCPFHEVIIFIHENVNDIGISISETGCGYVSGLPRYISWGYIDQGMPIVVLKMNGQDLLTYLPLGGYNAL